MKTKDPSALEDVQGPSQDANKHANLLYTIDPGGIIYMHVVIKPMGYWSMRSNVRKMSSSKIDKYKYDVTLASKISDVILCFYLSILGYDNFRRLEPIESNPDYYTTLNKNQI